MFVFTHVVYRPLSERTDRHAWPHSVHPSGFQSSVSPSPFGYTQKLNVGVQGLAIASQSSSRVTGGLDVRMSDFQKRMRPGLPTMFVRLIVTGPIAPS